MIRHFRKKLLTPEICNLLASIHEYRGKQDLFITARKDVLQTLLEVAVIQSTDSSKRIEEIFTTFFSGTLSVLTADKAPDLLRQIPPQIPHATGYINGLRFRKTSRMEKMVDNALLRRYIIPFIITAVTIASEKVFLSCRTGNGISY